MDSIHTGDVIESATYALSSLTLWRRFLGVDRQELARRSHVSMTMLQYVERGRFRLRGRYVNRIARALGVPACILVEYTPLDKEAHAWASVAAISNAGRRLAAVS